MLASFAAIKTALEAGEAVYYTDLAIATNYELKCVMEQKDILAREISKQVRIDLERVARKIKQLQASQASQSSGLIPVGEMFDKFFKDNGNAS
jgi:hypothetical protein